MIQQWNSQVSFIKKSCEHYDAGDHDEAKRIATSLRIILHETASSHSLLKQLNYNYPLLLWSSGALYTPSNLISSWSLLSMQYGPNGALYLPHLDDIVSRTFFLSDEDWWNEIIFDDKRAFLTRRDIILFVANQDGGAHVDPTLSEVYADLIKNNSLGIQILKNGIAENPKNNPAYASIRQIGHEFLKSESIKNDAWVRTAYPDRLFEMRFVDGVRRFKWSSTDVKCSTETQAIIDTFTAEPRDYFTEKGPTLNREIIVKQTTTDSVEE